MSDSSPPSKSLIFAAAAGRLALRTAKAAGTTSGKLLASGARLARNEFVRRRAAAAERRRAEKEVEAQRVRQIEEAEAAKRAAAEKLNAMLPAINARWPEDRFHRTPRAVYLRARETEAPDANFANAREDLVDIWELMLRLYPTPPATDEERKAGEKLFWSRQAQRFSYTQDNGAIALAPKQEILDWWATYEKWVFREYYAATGVFHKSYFGNEFSEFFLWEKKKHTPLSYGHIPTQKSALGSLNRGYRKGYANSWNRAMHENVEHENNRIERDRDAYFKSFDDHKQKWGEWYFFNVEKAFNEMSQLPGDAPDPVHGDARLATEAEARNAAAGRGVRRSSLHDRDF